MNHIYKSAFFLLAFLCAPLAQSHANEGSDKLSLSVGYYDILDEDNAVDFRAEYRWDNPLLWEISPYAGLEVTSEGSVWGGVGLYADFFVNENVFITPSFGAGLYSQGGADLDLGHVIEFRSQIEIGYEFEGNDSVSLGFGHLSNASLDERNPGTEVLSIYYHAPVDWF